MGKILNKSSVANLISLLIVVSGYYLNDELLFSVGMFALSGAFTNWLAVHMLFEKVPGLYGSGVIPARFEEFKSAIQELMMNQFFTEENIDRFLSDEGGAAHHFDLTPIIKKVNLSPAFDALILTIKESSFGSMLSMVGGEKALEPMRERFVNKMRDKVVEVTQSEEFDALLRDELENPNVIQSTRDKVASIIQKRLDELTPELVKEIIQGMIRKHLGWLVVWGAIFGGMFGAAATLFG